MQHICVLEMPKLILSTFKNENHIFLLKSDPNFLYKEVLVCLVWCFRVGVLNSVLFFKLGKVKNKVSS